MYMCVCVCVWYALLQESINYKNYAYKSLGAIFAESWLLLRFWTKIDVKNETLQLTSKRSLFQTDSIYKETSYKLNGCGPEGDTLDGVQKGKRFFKKYFLEGKK